MNSKTPNYVQVTVLAANIKKIKSKTGYNSPYVTIGLGTEKYKTSVIENTNTPEWNETCDFKIPSKRANITLNVFHHLKLANNDFIGQVLIPLSDFENFEESKINWYPLKSKSGKQEIDGLRGELQVQIAFIIKEDECSLSMMDLTLAKMANKGSSIKNIAKSVGQKIKHDLSVSELSLKDSSGSSFHLNMKKLKDKISQNKFDKTKGAKDSVNLPYSNSFLKNQFIVTNINSNHANQEEASQYSSEVGSLSSVSIGFSDLPPVKENEPYQEEDKNYFNQFYERTMDKENKSFNPISQHFDNSKSFTQSNSTFNSNNSSFKPSFISSNVAIVTPNLYARDSTTHGSSMFEKISEKSPKSDSPSDETTRSKHESETGYLTERSSLSPKQNKRCPGSLSSSERAQKPKYSLPAVVFKTLISPPSIKDISNNQGLKLSEANESGSLKEKRNSLNVKSSPLITPNLSVKSFKDSSNAHTVPVASNKIVSSNKSPQFLNSNVYNKSKKQSSISCTNGLFYDETQARINKLMLPSVERDAKSNLYLNHNREDVINRFECTDYSDDVYMDDILKTLDREGLIKVIKVQGNLLRTKTNKLTDLADYIDRLIIKIMDHAPQILEKRI